MSSELVKKHHVTELVAKFCRQLNDQSGNPVAHFTVYRAIDNFYTQFIEARAVDPNGAILGVYAFMNEQQEALPKEVMESMSCRKGCAACCHINVTITLEEAAVIAAYCAENDIPINQAYMQEQVKLSEYHLARSAISACAFLKDKECSIYEVRPMSCRKHFVQSHPLYCDLKLVGNHETEIFFHPAVEIFMAAVLSASITQTGRLPKMVLEVIARSQGE